MRILLLLALLGTAACGADLVTPTPTQTRVQKALPGPVTLGRWDGPADPCDWPSLLPIPSC